MPDGWKRLYKTEYLELVVEGEGQPYKWLDDERYLLDLVKEMAEAIEQIMNEEAPCDESKDEGPVVDYVISINTIAGNVLKKFKEWK